MGTIEDKNVMDTASTSGVNSDGCLSIHFRYRCGSTHLDYTTAATGENRGKSYRDKYTIISIYFP